MTLDTKSPEVAKLTMDRLVLVSVETFLINEFTQEELASETLQFSISFQNLLSKTTESTFDDLEAIAEAGLLDELDSDLLDEIENIEDDGLIEEKEEFEEQEDIEEIEEGDDFDDEDFEEFGEESKKFFGGVDPDKVDADLRQREEQVLWIPDPIKVYTSLNEESGRIEIRFSRSIKIDFESFDETKEE